MDVPPKNDSSVSARILVIDDDPVVCRSCERILSNKGYRVKCHDDPRHGLQEALSGDYDVVLLDMMMPGMSGLEVLERLKSAGVSSEVVIITGFSTVESAVAAMKRGAADYVSKPLTPDELLVILGKTLERSALIRENLALRKELRVHQGFEGILGESRRMCQVFWVIKRVAPTDGTVLITGESGTGKEMVARAVHRLSQRNDKLLLACDCASLAPTLLESELFGHVKGSFSGAIATKQGLFEIADKGTLFLDEVANISLETQGKLLRVLETRRIKKVGGTEEREVDIRLIAATNRDLAEMVKEGTFREDLLYRLNVVPIHLPPLRERVEDIPKLAMAFLQRFCEENEVRVRGFSLEAMHVMETYRWPGNVRELKNIVERLAILYDTERIDVGHLPPELQQTRLSSSVPEVPRRWDEFRGMKQQIREAAVQDLEKCFLMEALRRSGGNVSRAAEDVGMQRTNFHSLMRKYGISSEDI